MGKTLPQKQCILLVEDNAVVRTLFETMLKEMGCQVIVAENGEDGLRAFEAHQHQIDAIISDLSMPVMNGIDMIDHIRKIDQDVPVAIVSAFDHEGKADVENRLHVRHFNKPAHVEELVSFLLGKDASR